MERIRLMVLKNFIYLPYMLFMLFKCGGKRSKVPPEERYRFLRWVCLRANRMGRVTVETHGLSNLPKENGYIMFPNHQGLYDTLALMDGHEQPFRVVMKKEMEKVFFVRLFRRTLCGLVMDREDVRQSMTVIKQMTKEVLEGANYVIFPEGTRSKNGNRLGEFKAGSFKSATKAKCPIVPVALIDCFQAFDTHSTEPLTVQVHYLAPIRYEEYADLKTMEIAAMVKERIEQVIAKNL